MRGCKRSSSVYLWILTNFELMECACNNCLSFLLRAPLDIYGLSQFLCKSVTRQSIRPYVTPVLQLTKRASGVSNYKAGTLNNYSYLLLINFKWYLDIEYILFRRIHDQRFKHHFHHFHKIQMSIEYHRCINFSLKNCTKIYGFSSTC